MGKFLTKFIALIFSILVIAIVYLSYVGIETNKFDEIIKDEANKFNKNIKLDFNKTKIHLNPNQLNLAVKLQDPKVIVRKGKINLTKLDLFLPLRSFISSDFILKRAEISFAKNDVTDLTKITDLFFPLLVNKRIKKVFSKGNLEGNFVIPFEKDGSIGKDYGFSGKVSEASINISKDFLIRDLTTEISNSKNINDDEFEISIKKGTLNNLELKDSVINLKRTNDKIKIESFISTNGKLNFTEIRKIASRLIV